MASSGAGAGTQAPWKLHVVESRMPQDLVACGTLAAPELSPRGEKLLQHLSTLASTPTEHKKGKGKSVNRLHVL